MGNKGNNKKGKFIIRKIFSVGLKNNNKDFSIINDKKDLKVKYKNKLKYKNVNNIKKTTKRTDKLKVINLNLIKTKILKLRVVKERSG